MDEAAGSSDKEMDTVEESISYKLNAFKQTWVGFAQEIMDRGDLGSMFDAFTDASKGLTETVEALAPVMSVLLGTLGGIAKAIGTISDNIGALGTIIAGLSIKSFVKNFGAIRDNLIRSIANQKTGKGIAKAVGNSLFGGINNAVTKDIIKTQSTQASFDKFLNNYNNASDKSNFLTRKQAKNGIHNETTQAYAKYFQQNANNEEALTYDAYTASVKANTEALYENKLAQTQLQANSVVLNKTQLEQLAAEEGVTEATLQQSLSEAGLFTTEEGGVAIKETMTAAELKNVIATNVQDESVKKLILDYMGLNFVEKENMALGAKLLTSLKTIGTVLGSVAIGLGLVVAVGYITNKISASITTSLSDLEDQMSNNNSEIEEYTSKISSLQTELDDLNETDITLLSDEERKNFEENKEELLEQIQLYNDLKDAKESSNYKLEKQATTGDTHDSATNAISTAMSEKDMGFWEAVWDVSLNTGWAGLFGSAETDNYQELLEYWTGQLNSFNDQKAQILDQIQNSDLSDEELEEAKAALYEVEQSQTKAESEVSTYMGNVESTITDAKKNNDDAYAEKLQTYVDNANSALKNVTLGDNDDFFADAESDAGKWKESLDSSDKSVVESDEFVTALKDKVKELGSTSKITGTTLTSILKQVKQDIADADETVSSATSLKSILGITDDSIDSDSTNAEIVENYTSKIEDLADKISSLSTTDTSGMLELANTYGIASASVSELNEQLSDLIDQNADAAIEKIQSLIDITTDPTVLGQLNQMINLINEERDDAKKDAGTYDYTEAINQAQEDAAEYENGINNNNADIKNIKDTDYDAMVKAAQEDAENAKVLLQHTSHNLENAQNTTAATEINVKSAEEDYNNTDVIKSKKEKDKAEKELKDTPETVDDFVQVSGTNGHYTYVGKKKNSEYTKALNKYNKLSKEYNEISPNNLGNEEIELTVPTSALTGEEKDFVVANNNLDKAKNEETTASVTEFKAQNEYSRAQEKSTTATQALTDAENEQANAEDTLNEKTQENLELALKQEAAERKIKQLKEDQNIQGLQDAQSAIEDLETVQDMYVDVLNGGTFDYSSLLDEDFEEKFGNLGDAYTNFVETVTKNPKDISACQSAFDNLTSAYMSQSDALENLTDDNKDQIKTMLKAAGMQNADEYVDQQLLYKNNKDKVSDVKNSYLKGDISKKEAQSQLNKLGFTSENSASMLESTTDAKEIAEKAGIDTNLKIGDLEDFGNANKIIEQLEEEGTVSEETANQLTGLLAAQVELDTYDFDQSDSIQDMIDFAEKTGIATDKLKQFYATQVMANSMQDSQASYQNFIHGNTAGYNDLTLSADEAAALGDGYKEGDIISLSPNATYADWQKYWSVYSVREGINATNYINDAVDTASTGSDTGAGDINADYGLSDENQKAYDEAVEYLDWVQTALDRISEKVDKLETQASSSFNSFKKRQKYYTKYINSLKEQIDAQETASGVYLSEYTKRANKYGISGSIRNKIENGAMTIEEMNTYQEENQDLYDHIQEVQDLYEQYKDAKNQADELRETEKQAELDSIQLVQDHADAYTEMYESEKEYATSAKQKNKYLEKETKWINESYDAQIKAAKLQTNSAATVKKLEAERQTKLRENHVEQLQNIQDEKDAYVDLYKAEADAAYTAKDKNKYLDKESKYLTQSYQKQIEIAKVEGNITKAKQLQVELMSELIDLQETALNNYKEEAETISSLNSSKADNIFDSTKKASYYTENAKTWAKAYESTSKENVKTNTTSVMADTYGIGSDQYTNASSIVTDNTFTKKNRIALMNAYANGTKIPDKVMKNLKSAASAKNASATIQKAYKDAKTYNEQWESTESNLSDTKSQNLEDIKKEERQSRLDADQVVIDSLGVESDYLSSKYSNAVGKDAKNENLQKQAQNIKDTEDANVQSLVDEYTTVLENGELLFEPTEEYYEKLKKLQEDEQKSLADNWKEQFDNISTDYEQFLKESTHLQNEYQNEISLAQAKGLTNYQSVINEQIDAQLSDQVIKQNELIELNAKLAEGLKNGTITEGSDTYYEMMDAIYACEEAVDGYDTSIQQLKNDLDDLNFSNFKLIEESIGALSDEAQFYIDLMSNYDMTKTVTADASITGDNVIHIEGLSDLGSWGDYLTSEGAATASLYETQYGVAQSQANDYWSAYQKYKEAFQESGSTNDKDKMNEAYQAWQESVKSQQSAQKSIVDMFSNIFDSMKEALSKVIDEITSALDDEKDLYDYQKSILEKTNTVKSLQRQMTALSGSVSEENQSTLQSLSKSLKDAEDDLYETEWDRQISDIKDALSTLSDEFDEWITNALKDPTALLKQMSDYLSSESVRSDITETIGNVLSDIDDNLNSNNISEALQSTLSGTAVDLNDDGFIENVEGFEVAVENFSTAGNTISEAATTFSNEVAKLAEKLWPTDQTVTDNDSSTTTSTSGYNVFSDSAFSDIYSGSGDALTALRNVSSDNLSDAVNQLFNYFEHYGDRSSLDSLLSSTYGGYVDESSILSDYAANGAETMSQDELEVLEKYYTDNYEVSHGVIPTDIKEKLKSLRGYKTGGNNILDDWAWTNENGNSEIVRTSDGAILTPIGGNGTVWNAEQTQALWDLSNGNIPNSGDLIVNTVDPSSVATGGTNQVVTNQFQITMNGVNDPETFAQQLKSAINTNTSVQKTLQANTVDLTLGKNSLSGRRY